MIHLLKIKTRNSIFFAAVLFALICCGCKKFVEVPEPVNTITSGEAFSTDANATAAVMQIYNNMIAGNSFVYSNGLITLYAGLSADELNYFDQSITNIVQIQQNTLIATPNSDFYGGFWTPAYNDIYKANAAIEGLTGSTTLSTSTKNQLIGEAKSLRAFIYFYLVNFFGDVPLDTTTAWESTALMSRTSKDLVYQKIRQDLQDAIPLLNENYAISGEERIRVNRFAAKALLARVYLFSGDWANAEKLSNEVISNTTLYSLSDDLDVVFLKNSGETILQLQLFSNNYPNATKEGNTLIPSDSVPVYTITDQLLTAFEPTDKRRLHWIDSTIYFGTVYHYPKKYKVRVAEDGNVTEYYMVLRLAEQYLISAEAKAQQNKLSDAIADLNVIRHRAGLDSLPDNSQQANVLAAVAKERQIELFAEWGHRWLDLKRTDQADNVLSMIKPQWTATQKLYPIPVEEIQTDPNLTQNPGY